jgi:uncharacterized protein (DUF1800 family)
MKRLVLGSVVLALGCASGAPSAKPSVSVASIKSTLTRDQQVDHALSRLTFGARPGDAARVKSMGLEKWIALQLSPERVDDAASDSIIGRYRSLNTPTAELTTTFREVREERRARQRADSMGGGGVTPQGVRRPNREQMQARRDLQQSIAEVGAAKLMRAVVSERQLYEQMVDFWENHFSVFQGKGNTRLFIPEYDREVIRPNAMGKFRDLLGGVAKSPAMLFYLDNQQSIADSGRRTLVPFRRPARGPGQNARGLNENYARELMELHTLGVDGGYTQQDVIEVARALTGWSIDPQQGAFVFRPAVHDAEAKTVLGVALAPGRGMADGEQVLDILASHPSTARYITKKLVVRFVSDTAPKALVDRCAAEFTRTEGDIRQTLRCIVASPEFFSQAAVGSKVKTPFEFVASALRATGSRPDLSPRAAQSLTRLGQPIFGRQTPDGWPDRAEDWMNAGAMMNRVNFATTLASGRVQGFVVGSIDAAMGSTLASPAFQRR